jgi:hypothetical protein
MSRPSPKAVQRLINAPKLREAEKFASARCSIQYQPSRTSRERTAIENDRLRQGLCIHGKYPRLLAEGLSRVLGQRVPHCNRCA